MSAPGRKAYLGETVHLVCPSAVGKLHCRPATVTSLRKSFADAIEVYAYVHPTPEYMWIKFDENRAFGTFHWAH